LAIVKKSSAGFLAGVRGKIKLNKLTAQTLYSAPLTDRSAYSGYSEAVAGTRLNNISACPYSHPCRRINSSYWLWYATKEYAFCQFFSLERTSKI
jgi:hypothetical protein